MRRTDGLWQGMVLVLVLLMTLGIYLCLGALLLRLRNPASSAAGQLAGLSPDAGLVQILEPAAGLAVQRDTDLVVRAAVLESGFLQADLVVDGYSAGVRINLEPGAAPWLVEWQLQTAVEGSHSLVVRAADDENAWSASAPVTVTVVPRGRLLFASNREGAYALYAMDTDGGGLERLTEGPGTAQQPTSGPGGRLAYVAETGDGRSVIRQRDAEGRETDLVAGWDPEWLRPPPGQAGESEQESGVTEATPAWLAYTASLNGLSQVFVVEVPGWGPPQGTGLEGTGEARAVTDEEAYAGQPAWSPPVDGAGTRLAYVAERERNSDIWLVSTDAGPDGLPSGLGGGPQRLTDDPAMDWAPAWSPDGTRLAFVSDRSGSHQVYVVRADGASGGQGVRQLADLGQGTESPAWSPDGFWLAVVAYTGHGTGVERREIYLVRVDGRGMVRLTHNAFDDTDVVWAWEP